MTNNLTYLTKEQAIQLLNDNCLCCETKIPIRVSSRTSTHQSDDFEYEQTTITSTVQELDIYLIQVQPPKFSGLDDKMKGIYTKLKNQITKNATALQNTLEAQLQLPPEEKQRVIQAAVKDSLKDLEQKQTRFPPYEHYCDLDTKVANLIDTLQLNDLQHQTLKHIRPKWTSSASYAYNPGCLKTHITCWPFKEKPTQEWQILTMRFGKFYETIIKTPNFQNYPQHVEDAKEVLNWMKPQPIHIGIKRYNPLNYTGIM